MGRNPGTNQPPSLLVMAGMIFVVLLIFNLASKVSGCFAPAELTFQYGELDREIENGNIGSIKIKNSGEIEGLLNKPVNEKTAFKIKALPFATMEDAQPLINQIKAKNPKAVIEVIHEGDGWLSTLVNLLPIIILVLFLVFMMKMTTQGNGKVMQFGKSKAKLVSPTNQKVTFADVKGVDEAKEELVEIVEFLKNPRKFTALGGRLPRGVLLVGPPGTGKTMLAKAVAGEAGVPFFSISGSDFVEMFVGVGASRVRDLFERAKQQAPGIIFIDEIDAVGRHRGTGLGGGHDEREQTLNQLLAEMDGFESNNGVIVIAATNRPDVLDPALQRPGRFDRQVVVNRPDIKGRQAILEIHASKTNMDPSVKLDVIARGTPGFVGAELANLINEAALNAARRDNTTVTMEDLEYAKDKVLMGLAKHSLNISEDEKETTAIHEAGHTVVAVFMPHADPIHKVTIVPRGMSMGSTWQLPVDDKHNYSEDYLKSQLAILMGGRAAEEVFLKGQKNTGASSDIERATDIARRMVREWGMSGLGPVNFQNETANPFLGKQLSEDRGNYSEDTARKIDAEIKTLLDNAYHQAQTILRANSESTKAIAKKLLEKEVLSGDEVRQIIDGPK
ncbi:MAG: cell division protein FtsH [Candidatus Yanofskybacteria bacterium RIFCSPHIGHO2_02_FULL_44_12b]|uniref:ATP-dependent zinc metalloprotease FtsH n=1 Tax=Candidatus Yanofskybacteria bacterium GW2011_GWA2_44_9 TaxID=1619025 RepID=A0A0G1NDW1_9BACT|nr:MAG: ATP-dependent zinc metalloprotease FtsH [Candidatus Yanofskybacteria bacterium GW2011_GWA2_44_9]OGN05066.1 MAG: cell division protein FtsH [Candidatus Yanofskybacteria bacterium RIFCSPHIGHO2_01_FULL_44_24]OGN14899.1 MAG: cell division protein FtsH [Candidatus Yanofskybacteria bacterium RIFCSPHIGHO2_02_FULL_44_12b]